MRAPRGWGRALPARRGWAPLALDAATDFVEVQGTAPAGNTLYGLVMAQAPLAVRESTAKFVWRMTGSGDLIVAVTRPDGSVGALAWGPEPHSGSSYHRPGDEWGTGVDFDAAGCWELAFTRGPVAASVYLDVAPGQLAG